jgi:hypothetical protein
MKGAQKVIKWFALALAALLIVTIFSGIIGGLSFVGMMVWGDEISWNGSSEWVNTEFSGKEMMRLDVSVKATAVRIRTAKEGEPVRIETNNEYITSWVDGSTLNVVEKSHGFFGWGGTGDLVIYVREDTAFDSVEIEIGAGTLDVERLEAKDLKLNLGAGKTAIDELIATRRAEIDGGAGVVEIRGGELHDLDLDLGAGKAELRARVVGNGRVTAGVGKTELTLIGREEDYRLRIDKGIGSVTLDGRSLSDGESVGSGATLIEIDSGVGAVEMKIVEE